MASWGGLGNGRVRALAYDSLDAVVVSRQLGNPDTTFAYDQLGQVTQQTTVGPLVAGKDPVTGKAGLVSSSLFTSFEYNAFGQVIEQRDQTGAKSTTASTYDLLGRVSEQTQKNGWQKLRYSYDAAGHTLEVKDTVYPLWRLGEMVNGPFKGETPESTVERTTATRYAYDPLGRVASETDTYWKATQYRYDALGRVEAVWGRDGKLRWFGRDAVGRVVTESWGQAPAPQIIDTTTNPLGSTAPIPGATVIATAYDAADRVALTFQGTTTLAVNAPAGRFAFVAPQAGAGWTVAALTKVALGYDSLGRVKTETQGNVTLTHSYDAASRGVKVADDKGGQQTTKYDLAGRVEERTFSRSDGKGAVVSFTYRDGTNWEESVPTYRDDRVRTIIGRDTLSVAPVVGSGIYYDKLGRQTRRTWTTKGQASLAEDTITRYQPDGLVWTDTRQGSSTVAAGQWAAKSVLYHYDKFSQVERQDTITGPDPTSPLVDKPGTTTKRDASGNGPYPTQVAAVGTGNRVTDQKPYYVWYDTTGEQSTGTEGNVVQVRSVPNEKLPAEAQWKYEYDGRERLVVATQEQGPLKVRVEYAYDPFDRLVGRAVSQGTTTDPSAVWTHYLYADGQPYADATTDGTITARYLFSTDGAPLARLMGGAGTPDFYLADRQNSVLQIADAAGTTLKRVRYEGLKAVERVGAAVADRFELGGQTHDREVGLSMLGGSWFHPGLGRNLTENGRGIGLNPYPVAENNAPNEIEPSYNGSVDTGLNAVERYLGAAWNNPGKFGRGAVNGVTIGISEWVRQDLMGDDRSKWTLDEQRALDTGEGVGTAVSLLLAYGWVGRGVGLGAKFGIRAVQGATALERGQKVVRASYTATATWRGVQLGAEGIHNNTTNPYLKRAAGYTRVGAGFMKAFSSLGMAGRAVGMVGGAFGAPGRAAVALGGFGLLGYSGYGLYKMWSNDRVSIWDKWTATAEFAGGLAGGLLRGRTFREAMGSGEQSVLNTRWGQWWQSKRWGAGEYLGRVAHDSSYSLWSRVPAWAAARASGFRACFVAGTPIQWQYGAKAIELFRSYEEYGDDCDWIISRNEHNEDGILTLRRVLRKFVRTGLVLNLKLPGGIIGTTGEHPFWLKGRGWTPAQELKPGDQIRLMEPGWVTVEGVEDTGLVETVYNLEIEDDHTYFVGCDEWGFSVWAHNARCTPEEVNIALATAKSKGLLRGGEAEGVAKLVNDPNVPVEAIAGRLSRYKDRLGLTDEQLSLVAGELRIKAGDLPAVGTPANLPTVLTPTPGPHVGRVYLVNNGKPIPVDLSNPNWKAVLKEHLTNTGQLNNNGVAPGIYILRHPETGQLYKPGKNENLLGGRFGEYEQWGNHGVPVVADVYPLPGKSGITLETAENNLRHFIAEDGWGRLQSDIKYRKPSQQQVIRITTG